MLPAHHRLRLASALLLLAPLLLGAADINRLRSPVTHDGLIGVAGTDALPPLHFNGSALLGYAYNPLVWRFEDGTYEPVIEHQLTMEAMFTLGIVRFIDLSVGIPVLLWQDGPPPADPTDPDPFLVDLGEIRGSALGDLRVIPRIQFADERTFGFGGSFESEFTFNTGEPGGGRQRYFGDPGISWRPRVVGSTTVSIVRIIGALGFHLRNIDALPERVADTAFTHEWEWHLGAVVNALQADPFPLQVIAELAGANAWDFSGGGLTSLELRTGARARLADTVALTLGYSLGLTSGIGTPLHRVMLGFSYAPKAEDQDGDGIPDNLDACPYDPEDHDGFEDSDGCPDLDNDEDGIPDSEDRCPNEPEDFNGFADHDGCPDEGEIDTDGDGIPDIHDKCPTEAEDYDGFQDDDGCPDFDNDFDGVPDTMDLCPDEKETINGIDDYDGCPDEGEGLTELLESRIEIKETILFESGKAIIKEQSKTVLDQVALQILANPEIMRVRIEGHTDSLGNDDDNLYLSQDRADSVRRYLMDRGVPGDKLEAVGYGETQPIATNATPAGRAKNRRVDFVIIQSAQPQE